MLSPEVRGLVGILWTTIERTVDECEPDANKRTAVVNYTDLASCMQLAERLRFQCESEGGHCPIHRGSPIATIPALESDPDEDKYRVVFDAEGQMLYSLVPLDESQDSSK